MPTHPIAEILPAWLAASEPSVAIPLALFLFGLVGGFAHCAGMCGPFVIAQTGLRLEHRDLRKFGTLERLEAGLLPLYHLGRATTYAILGGAAAGLTGLASSLVGGHEIASIGLALAALVFALISLGSWRPRGAPLAGRLAGIVAGLSARAGTATGTYLTGLLLGFLPCHLVYAALAASTVLADPLGGALSMTAFTVGTSAGLVTVGSFGALAGHRFRSAARRFLPLAGLSNSIVLAVLAVRVAMGG